MRVGERLRSGKPIHVNLTAVKCQGLNDSSSNIHDVLIPNTSIQNLKPPQVLDFVITENDEEKRGPNLLVKKDEEDIPPHTSSSSQPVPFYQPLVNVLKPWFSPKAWASYFDRKLDSVANAILSYSEHVYTNAPASFPNGTLRKGKHTFYINHTQGGFYTTSPQLPNSQSSRLSN